MKLDVRPEDLRAAAATVATAADLLFDADRTFAGEASATVGDVGNTVVAAAIRTADKTHDAVHAIATDLRHFATALHHLADLYPGVDQAAVR
jgi:hypothetical protein